MRVNRLGMFRRLLYWMYFCYRRFGTDQEKYCLSKCQMAAIIFLLFITVHVYTISRFFFIVTVEFQVFQSALKLHFFQWAVFHYNANPSKHPTTSLDDEYILVLEIHDYSVYAANNCPFNALLRKINKMGEAVCIMEIIYWRFSFTLTRAWIKHKGWKDCWKLIKKKFWNGIWIHFCQTCE